MLGINDLRACPCSEQNFKSRSSLGVMLGGSYYIGDLNQFGHFKNTNFSGGIIYRYHVNSRLELRGGLRYGRVEGYDADSKDPYRQARNLSFESQIFEVAEIGRASCRERV